MYYTLLILSILSCQNEAITLDYCKMIKDDQSYVNTDKSNMSQFISDKEKRSKLIKQNFNLLIKKTKQTGFPNLNIHQMNIDTCKNRAVTMTMIHASQTNPKQFYDKKLAKLFKKEIENGKLDKEILRKSSIITARTIELCSDYKSEIEKALELWDIDPQIFAQAKFIDCD